MKGITLLTGNPFHGLGEYIAALHPALKQASASAQDTLAGQDRCKAWERTL
jgi:hypothetical protein